MTATLPTPTLRVRIFPETGWAAMEAHEEILYVTWAALDVFDLTGSGKVARAEARQFITAWRRLDRRSIRRIHAEGEDRGYWTTSTTRDGVEQMFLTSIARLLVRFDLDFERAPRRVPLASLQTPAAMRAALYASVHELPGHADHFRNAPLSRATKRELTGVPDSERWALSGARRRAALLEDGWRSNAGPPESYAAGRPDVSLPDVAVARRAAA